MKGRGKFTRLHFETICECVCVCDSDIHILDYHYHGDVTRKTGEACVTNSVALSLNRVSRSPTE